EDLFWAVRGGTGNNFGVLLEATYQLHHLPKVWAWGLRWEMEEAAEVLNELQKNFMLTHDDRTLGFQGAITTNEGKQCVMMRGMVNGDEAAGRAAIAGMMEIGNPTLQLHAEGSYMEWDDGLLDGVPPITPTENGFPLKEDKFSVYLGRVLTVAEWQEVFDFFATAPNPGNTIGMEIGGGAVSAYPAGKSAYIHRDVYMDFFVDSFWYDPEDEEKAKQWILDFRAIMEKYWNGHSYQNYPRRDNTDYRYMYFGEAFNSLLAVKQKYDPDNFFTFPQAIEPIPDDAPAEVRRPSSPSRFG
ncbi:MAG: BBE domain-containing protein, partial [Gemmatimonadota bacterium]